MSRAFVKEEEGAAWTPAAPARAYRAVWRSGPRQDVVYESDDLLDVLRWMSDERRPDLELRDAAGVLLGERRAG